MDRERTTWKLIKLLTTTKWVFVHPALRVEKKSSMWGCYLGGDPAVYGARQRFFGAKEAEDHTVIRFGA
jgi:hypothetical protein